MAVTKFGAIAAQEIKDSISNATVEQITTTDNTTLYGIEIDNRNNTVAVFTKLWVAAATPVIGTNNPDFMFRTPAGVRNPIILGTDLTGVTAGAANDIYAVTTTGSAGSNTTSPANDVFLTSHTAAV